jgi:hypothetical protein
MGFGILLPPESQKKTTFTCCSTFIANCGVIAPLVINSSNESVKAIPILNANQKKKKEGGFKEQAKKRGTYDEPR